VAAASCTDTSDPPLEPAKNTELGQSSKRSPTHSRRSGPIWRFMEEQALQLVGLG